MIQKCPDTEVIVSVCMRCAGWYTIFEIIEALLDVPSFLVIEIDLLRGKIVSVWISGICDSVAFFSIIVDSSNSLHSLPRGGLPWNAESTALMKRGCSLSLPAGRVVCLTGNNGAHPTVFLSAASIMRSYGFAKKPARSRNMNRMRKESMILQHPRFRMLFRFRHSGKQNVPGRSCFGRQPKRPGLICYR